MLLALALCAVAPHATAEEPLRAITHEDLWLMKRVGAPTPSPDGRWVVFGVVEPAYDEKQQVSDLWIVPADGSAPARRLTSTAGGEAAFDWSPDSTRLVFVARREGDEAAQLYLLDLQGAGDAHRLTGLVNGARAPRFSPDGRRVVFASTDYPGANSEEDNRRIAAERRAQKWKARIYEGFPIRNWDRWLDDRRPGLFVIDLLEKGAAASAPRSLLRGTKLVAEKGYAGREGNGEPSLDAVWTPDGQSVLFVASIDRDRAAYDFTSRQLFRVALAGGEPQQLTSGKDSWSNPAFTPDGRTLLVKRSRRAEKVYVHDELLAFGWGRDGPRGDGLGRDGVGRAGLAATPRVLTSAAEVSVGAYAVTADSRRVYFLAETAGLEKLFVVDLAAGAAAPAFDMKVGAYTGLAIAERSRELVMVANHESATRPPEVVRIDPQSGKHVALSDFTGAAVAKLDLAPVEHFWFTSKQGRAIHNMLVRPPGFDPSRKYPLLVVIHGGPHTMWRDQWVLRWNYHLLAAPGYVVLLTNYTGSTGFSETFAQAIQGDPLRSPGDELNEAADEAIRRYAFIDATRQCAGGASYGGHLANWLQATTDRYRCLISHAGLVNLESQWGTSDVIYSREINNGGPVWEQGPVWREQNPIRYAANFRTPTLVTIGEQDFRVPLNNSLEYWSVLQRQQVPSRLVVFPDENHWILKGENSRLFYRELHDWLARWLASAP